MIFNEIFTPAAVAANWTDVAATQVPYLGTGLFPSKKKAGLDLAWIKGHKGLPVALAPSTFDAKARFRDRIGVAKIETEMPFFREGYLLKEKDRQEMLRAQSANDPYATAVIERVFDDTRDLIAGANVVPERMIWQLLAPVDGKPGIHINAHGVDLTYDYDPDGAWQANNYTALTDGAWNDAAAADPIGDLMALMSAHEARTGTKLKYAVMSRKTMNYLMKSEKMKAVILTVNPAASVVLTDNIVKQVVAAVLGLNLIIYGNQYLAEDKTVAQFMPDDVVTLLPEGALGSTWYGTTPEEADLMASNQAEVSIVNTGVAITRIVKPHPVNIELYASEIVLPSFERMDEVAVLKVV